MANILEAVMKYYKEPLTRENFLKLKHGGKVPSQIAPEDEEETPARFRLASPTHEEVKAEEDKKLKGKDVAAKSKPKPVPPPVYKPSTPAVTSPDLFLGDDKVKHYNNPHNVEPARVSDTDELFAPSIDGNHANPAVGDKPLIPTEE